jgi:sorbitol-specific phosphotransferase system component IIBC
MTKATQSHLIGLALGVFVCALPYLRTAMGDGAISSDELIQAFLQGIITYGAAIVVPNVIKKDEQNDTPQAPPTGPTTN